MSPRGHGDSLLIEDMSLCLVTVALECGVETEGGSLRLTADPKSKVGQQHGKRVQAITMATR